VGKQTAVRYPDHIVDLPSVTTPAGEFVVGESVWVTGWRKSPQSTNTVLRIVQNTRSQEIYVNAYCQSRGRGQWHSFHPDRLSKRTEKKRRPPRL
jgi:hypothetical protein